MTLAFLVRHRALPECWYAVKRLSKLKMRSVANGYLLQQLMERERELLLLLGRETRGTKVADLFVRFVTAPHPISPTRDLHIYLGLVIAL